MDENQPFSQLAVAQTPQRWLVNAADSGRRLDVFLATYLCDFTRREIVEWVVAGNARINGRLSKKGTRVYAGDTVALTVPTRLHPNPHLPIQLLFVDDDIVLLNKPSGIPSVALRQDETGTVANFLLARFPETATASSRPLESGVVHRLDTATSGALLAARTAVTYTALRNQFSERLVEKQYLALVHGQLQHAGERRSHLTPTGGRGQRMREATTDNGQEAQTFYAPVTQFPRHTLVQVTIPTGVRHQIRVHLATLGHPIVGDVVYGNPEETSRLCLHAETLSFLHPQTRTRVHFTCPLPEDFQMVLQEVSAVRIE